ncbi:MAG TPA: hypothetical protein VFS40_09765 [Gemmatimonadales bacterium]|nr:hypothetical protein [Gemmatimonadales bacterium]
MVLPAAPAVAAPVVRVAATRGDTAPEAVLLELRLGRLASRTVSAYRVGDEALLPLTQLLSLAEVQHRLLPGGRLEGVWQPGNVPLVVDVHADTVRLGARRVPLAARDRWLDDAELYVAGSVLRRLLDVDLVVSWSDLEVVVRDPERLPLGMRIRREAARAAFLAGTGRPGAGSGAVLALERPSWDGLVLDYSLSAPSSGPIEDGTYALGLGADVGGGALQLGLSNQSATGGDRVRAEASWLGVWRGNRYLKQLRLGDGGLTGAHPRAMQGLLVTNAPYLRPSLLGVAPYTGRLPAGWQLEAYRGGQLVALDSAEAGGAFAVDLPVLYGENPVTFRAYGPHGEVREFESTYRVPSTLLPARRFEYGLSAGRCRDAACRAAGNLDLRYGVASRLTVQAGIDRFWRDSTGSLTHPYVGLAASLTNAWAIEGEVVGHGYTRGGLRFEPSLDLRLAADVVRYDTGVAAPLLQPAARRTQWIVTAFVRPRAGSNRLYFDARAEHLSTTTGTLDDARLGASVQVAHARVMPYVRLERQGVNGLAATRTFSGAEAFVLPSPRWGPLLRSMWFRGLVETGDGTSVSRAFARVARPLAAGVRIETGADWTRDGGAAVTLTLSSYLRSVRTLTTVVAPSRGPTAASQLVQGSVLFDRRRRAVAFAAGPALQRAGVTGRVFLDANGNGLYDVGEEGLGGVRVRVGLGSAVSDSTGEYRIWDLTPFEPVQVEADSLSFASPLWLAGAPVAYITPGPNRFTVRDVPIVNGGLLEGRVMREGVRLEGVGGVTLVLTNRKSGERRTFTTFGDGAFYTLGIRPGEYDLGVAPAVLELLGVDADPVRLTIDADGEVQEGGSLEILLHPR